MVAEALEELGEDSLDHRVGAEDGYGSWLFSGHALVLEKRGGILGGSLLHCRCRLPCEFTGRQLPGGCLGRLDVPSSRRWRFSGGCLDGDRLSTLGGQLFGQTLNELSGELLVQRGLAL